MALIGGRAVRRAQRLDTCRPGVAPPTRLPGFQPSPHHWIVERAFGQIGQIGRYRRLSRDYEFLPASSDAWIYLSMPRLMLKRLAGEHVQPAFHYRHAA